MRKSSMSRTATPLSASRAFVSVINARSSASAYSGSVGVTRFRRSPTYS